MKTQFLLKESQPNQLNSVYFVYKYTLACYGVEADDNDDHVNCIFTFLLSDSLHIKESGQRNNCIALWKKHERNEGQIKRGEK